VSLPEPLLDEPTQRHATVRANAAGLGCALPPVVVANAHVAGATGVDEAWIERRTGIRSRRRAPAELSLLSLATNSARAALADAGIHGASIDLVIVATVSQERRMPNIAPQLAAAIGAEDAGAFDLGAACSGFVSGLAVATAMIEAERVATVLLVGADTLLRHVDPHDRRTAALFGDGAGAIVLGAGQRGGVSALELGSDGGAAELIATDPATDLIRMDGQETFRVAVASISKTVSGICARAELDPLHDIDLFVFHQANARITRAVCERLRLPAEKVVERIADVGNTSAASVPLALEQARDEGRLLDGSRVLLAAVGAGFVSASAILEWGGA
jgi:3-oxoacyl-[acyl-carrier-protein] synthase-3